MPYSPSDCAVPPKKDDSHNVTLPAIDSRRIAICLQTYDGDLHPRVIVIGGDRRPLPLDVPNVGNGLRLFAVDRKRASPAGARIVSDDPGRFLRSYCTVT